MSKKRYKGGPRLLATDRESAIFLERARVKVEGERVVYYIVDDEHRREYNIPHVNLAVLFLGQGTSITQDAMRLLGEERVHIAVTGTGGTPLHMGSLTTYTATEHFREMLVIYQNDECALGAAKTVMRDRALRMSKVGNKNAKRFLRVRDLANVNSICEKLVDDLDRVDNIPSLLGVEGAFSKRCYKAFAGLSGLSTATTFRREPNAGDTKIADDPVKLVNSLIDHGNYLCYGMAGAALWALGVPPQMAVFHGKTRAGGLVFDLADSFKDAFVLPLAFAAIHSDRQENPERLFRARMITAFDDHRVLKLAIDTVNRILLCAADDKA